MRLRTLFAGLAATSVAVVASAADGGHSLPSAEGLVPHGVVVESANFLGHDSIKLEVQADHLSQADGGCDNCTFAEIDDVDFSRGSIDIDVAGRPAPNAPPWAKGFVGVVFHVSDDVGTFEGIYLRPVNAVADDEELRSHTVQYFAYPDYPWHRLREESPGVYESYADVAPGEWIHLRIDINDGEAAVTINQSDRPALVVKDLKLGPNASGTLGLYTEPATEAYFRELLITADE